MQARPVVLGRGAPASAMRRAEVGAADADIDDVGELAAGRP